MPWTHPFFEDKRFADIDDGGALAYQALVRIPIGTALFEELAFRGVLFALIARWRSTAAAVTAVGGGLFCALRMATAGLAAPVIVHAAANSLSLLAAYAVVHGV